MLRLGWFSTARGPTSRRLLAAVWEEITSGRLVAEIEVVFCNREPGEDPQTDMFFEQVRAYGLPSVCLSSSRFRKERGGAIARAGQPLPEWRLEFDREVMARLQAYEFDLGVLAGYMLIVSGEMCRRYDLLNLHPALPGGPKGAWQEVIWQLIESRAERAGVMMHLATSDVDEGPPVTYTSYAIRGPAFEGLWRKANTWDLSEIKAKEGEDNELFAEIRRHGVERELPLIVETLRAFADGRIRVLDKRPVNEDGRRIKGYDLTSEIERRLRAIRETAANTEV